MSHSFVRTLIYSLLWFFYLLSSYQDLFSLSWLILLFSCTLALFFFTNIIRSPLLLFIPILLLLSLTTLFTSYSPYILGIIAYISVEAAFTLAISRFRLYIYFSVLIIGFESIYFRGSISVISFILLIFLFFLCVKVNEFLIDRKEKQELYEILLGEYRGLKRLLYITEQNSKAEERTRIARDIHDSVGHKLTALLMRIEMLTIEHGTGMYKDLKKLAEESLEETREAVNTLKMEEISGIHSVLQLIRKLESESHTVVQLTTKHGILSTKLNNEQSITLYRCIQEGLTNAMKHAHVREINITLGKTAIGDLQFEVSNAISRQNGFQPGFGLTNMKERIERIGGNLTMHQTEKEFVLKGSFSLDGEIRI
jgi:signal transduction histidine kinase